ncbi:hypothetical protein GCM10010495_69420 [Kitasatospora herbaricolor]|uniref:hypothetical protein n=1 Tax=Kitasatospora herbaricolor TaxID=68217 RepID=UPI00174D0A14|nr:hypothetical protein [Kitasatospora herbaricolor]MDQ0313343.1 hypothetical protein [Kitasatospora herbaricolor]GGV41917.1 hypothetical protein GCM10010495_69420 [Kitasatospora herbaricolor]
MDSRNKNRCYIISSDIKNYRGKVNGADQEEWQKTLRDSIGSAAEQIGLQFDYEAEKRAGNLQAEGDSITWRIADQQVEGYKLATDFIIALGEQLKSRNNLSGGDPLSIRIAIDLAVLPVGPNGWLGDAHQVGDMRDCSQLRDSLDVAPQNIAVAVSRLVYQDVKISTRSGRLFHAVSYKSKSGEIANAWIYVPGAIPWSTSKNPKKKAVYWGAILASAVLAGAVAFWLANTPEKQKVESLKTPPAVKMTAADNSTRPTFEASRAGRYMALTVSLENPQGSVNDCLHQATLMVGGSSNSPEVPLVPGQPTIIDLGAPTNLAHPVIRLAGVDSNSNCVLMLGYDEAVMSDSISLLKEHP